MPAGLCRGLRELEGEKGSLPSVTKEVPIAGDVAMHVLDTVSVPCVLGSTRTATEHESLHM